jgi:outer membrane lipoprotein carrier protein
MAGNLPIAMELRDQFGNIVLLSFSNLKTNIPISPSQFIFKAPSGAEVLKLQ